jgi:hypothetical protein
MEIPRDEVPAAAREELLALAAAQDARNAGRDQSVSAVEERVFKAVWRSMQTLANAKNKPWAAGVTLLGYLDSWVADPIPLPHPDGAAANTTVEVSLAPFVEWCSLTALLLLKWYSPRT